MGLKPRRHTWGPNVHYDEAIALLRTEPAAAIEHFENARRAQPTRGRIHANLAWALSNVGRHDDAVRAAVDAIELDPADGYLLARCVHVLGEAGRWAEVAQRSASLDGVRFDNPDDRRFVRESRCWALMQQASFTDALRETTMLVEDWPRHAEVCATHGSALAALCRWDDGIVWLDTAILLDPTDPRYPARREAIARARDHAHHALDELRDAANREPESPARWRDLALGLARFARLEESVDAFSRASVLEPYRDELSGEQLRAAMVEATVRQLVLVGESMPVGAG